MSAYWDTRWQCRCGRFVAAGDVRSEDYRDNNQYGVATKTHYLCSRCGEVEGDPEMAFIRKLVTNRRFR